MHALGQSRTEVMMNAEEARAAEAEIFQTANQHIRSGDQLRSQLIAFEERRGYAALGYATITAWGNANAQHFFGMTRSYLTKQLTAAVIERELRDLVPSDDHIPEVHLRPLAMFVPGPPGTGSTPKPKVIDGDAIREVFQAGQQIAADRGERFAARHVEEAVAEYREAAEGRAAPPPSTMKPKINRLGTLDEPQGYDACQTPPEAIDPLLPYLPSGWTIWESACGENMLVDAFYDAGYTVTGSDILTGGNFFESAPDEWDCQVTNPPYSIKYEWLARSYALGKPFALLMPIEVLGARRAQVLFIEHGVQIILLNRRVNFKMPSKGWDGGGAQFPVAWFTWGLDLETQLVFGTLP